jgi:hypothetical protein
MVYDVLIVGNDVDRWMTLFLTTYRGIYVSNDSTPSRLTLYTICGNIDLNVHMRRYVPRHMIETGSVDMVILFNGTTLLYDKPYCVVYISENPSMHSIDDHMVVEGPDMYGLYVFRWISKQCHGAFNDLRQKKRSCPCM